MAKIKANLTSVIVYPKDLKAIPDILPFNKLIQGDPVALELTKKEIQRCMNFGDVYDITSGEEVLIDELTFKEIEEFVEDTENEEDGGEEDPEEPVPDEPENPTQPPEDPEGPNDPEENPDEGEGVVLPENEDTVELSEKGAVDAGVGGAIVR